MSLNFDFLMTDKDTETWRENGTIVQENDLRVWRFGVEVGYRASTWDRRLPPRALTGDHKWIRFTGGADLYYRFQMFNRQRIPSLGDVNESFNMFGGELVVDLEVGPRYLIAGFFRGRGGGGLVYVLNDLFDNIPGYSAADFAIATAGIQGTVEMGLVSQPIFQLEIRAGYRYFVMRVLGSDRTRAGIIVELPTNTTQIHMGFLEVGVPF
jgi:hypothetical protein